MDVSKCESIGAFLIKVTCNRFVDRIRQHRLALEHEVALRAVDAETVTSSRASESFKADELWHRMLEVCPPAHYDLLRLKREGASLAEIAARTGLHPSSIRRILYDIARRIAVWRTADQCP